MRILERISAVFMILLLAPLLVMPWLVLKFRGVRPVLTRADSRSGSSESGLLFFDARGDDLVSDFLKFTALDSMPSIFCVAFGSLHYSDLRSSGEQVQGAGQVDVSRWKKLVLIFIAITLVAVAIMWNHGTPR